MADILKPYRSPPMLIAESLSLCHSSTRRYSHRNADFIGELGNAHFSFREHELDVNDDCHIRLDSQVVLSDFISTAFCKIRSNTAAAVAMMVETKIIKAPIITPPATSSVPRTNIKM